MSLVDTFDLLPVLGTGGRFRERTWGRVTLRRGPDAVDVTLAGLSLPFDLVTTLDDPRGFGAFGIGWVTGTLDDEVSAWLTDQPALWHFLRDGGWLGGDGLHFPRGVLDANEVVAAARFLVALGDRLSVPGDVEHEPWWARVTEAVRQRRAAEVAMAVAARPVRAPMARLVWLAEAVAPGVHRDALDAELAERSGELSDPEVALAMLDATRSEDRIRDIATRAVDASLGSAAALHRAMDDRPELADIQRWLQEAILERLDDLRDPTLPPMAVFETVVVLAGVMPERVPSDLLQRVIVQRARKGNREALDALERWWQAVSPELRAATLADVRLGSAGPALMRRAFDARGDWSTVAPFLDLMIRERVSSGGPRDRSLFDIVSRLSGRRAHALVARLAEHAYEIDFVRGHALMSWIDLLGSCPSAETERVLLQFLDIRGQPKLSAEAARALGSVGTGASLPALRKMTGFLAFGSVPAQAAEEAIVAIEARQQPKGSITLAEGAGGLSTTRRGGEVSPWDDR